MEQVVEGGKLPRTAGSLVITRSPSPRRPPSNHKRLLPPLPRCSRTAGVTETRRGRQFGGDLLLEHRSGNLVDNPPPHRTAIGRCRDVESQHPTRRDAETRPQVGQRRRTGAVVRDQLPAGMYFYLNGHRSYDRKIGSCRQEDGCDPAAGFGSVTRGAKLTRRSFRWRCRVLHSDYLQVPNNKYGHRTAAKE